MVEVNDAYMYGRCGRTGLNGLSVISNVNGRPDGETTTGRPNAIHHTDPDATPLDQKVCEKMSRQLLLARSL